MKRKPVIPSLGLPELIVQRQSVLEQLQELDAKIRAAKNAEAKIIQSKKYLDLAKSGQYTIFEYKEYDIIGEYRTYIVGRIYEQTINQFFLHGMSIKLQLKAYDDHYAYELEAINVVRKKPFVEADVVAHYDSTFPYPLEEFNDDLKIIRELSFLVTR